MAEPGVVVRNWRDADPYVGHESAVIWRVMQSRSNEAADSSACLQKIGDITLHAVQGRKNSDHHQHGAAEQYYYVLSGQGEVLIGEQRVPVSEGSAAYFPPETAHQLFNEGADEWLEHLVISCSVERSGSEPRVVNWRDATPTAGVHGAAVTWLLLESVDEDDPGTDQPCLLGMHYLARQALVRGKASDNHKHDDKEQVYYVLEGWGTMIIEDQVHPVSEGDAVYLPLGASHQIINEEYAGWLSYLVIS